MEGMAGRGCGLVASCASWAVNTPRSHVWCTNASARWMVRGPGAAAGAVARWRSRCDPTTYSTLLQDSSDLGT